MDMVQLKIKKDASVIKYINIIRKFDSSLSISDIKRRIEDGDFAVEFDLEYFDVLEDLEDIDRRQLFRDMIRELENAGADISVYCNGEEESMEFLDNRLDTLEEIERQDD